MLKNLQQMQIIFFFRKESVKKIPEATGDLIGNKISNRITKVSKKIRNSGK